MVTWLPSTELYKSVEPLVKEGEKNLYLFGREVHLVFCNDPSRFGAGIGYLTARGDQAFFSLYVCEQTEEMSEKSGAMASLDRASGAPKSSTPRQVPPTLALYIQKARKLVSCLPAAASATAEEAADFIFCIVLDVRHVRELTVRLDMQALAIPCDFELPYAKEEVHSCMCSVDRMQFKAELAYKRACLALRAASVSVWYIRAQHVADSSNVACEMTRRRSARHEVGDRHRQNTS